MSLPLFSLPFGLKRFPGCAVLLFIRFPFGDRKKSGENFSPDFFLSLFLFRGPAAAFSLHFPEFLRRNLHAHDRKDRRILKEGKGTVFTAPSPGILPHMGVGFHAASAVRSFSIMSCGVKVLIAPDRDACGSPICDEYSGGKEKRIEKILTGLGRIFTKAAQDVLRSISAFREAGGDNDLLKSEICGWFPMDSNNCLEVWRARVRILKIHKKAEIPSCKLQESLLKWFQVVTSGEKCHKVGA